MQIQPETRVKRAARVSWQDIEGETVLLILEQEKLLGLNSVAAEIWKLADGKCTAQQIAALVAQDFRASEQRVLHDTLTFLDALVARGLLEIEGV